ncbi:hypothetical protein SNOG_09699 [Parastagonospora nodorum SN15]|uniref:Uncharacterized protein n=1 Tax=Phaeosphaeria nodorum (strain SN15 / ATCC MYA-4574 / FGSC 10173) TaxID=321614 RepID=Q0UEW5_PHANO|nr:hypothetical protein SNOG_09699 [Parastagonospora nodorum SN15]EAT82964.1 hypothetical protein SNOG_09699 [Parastagonospora nodorum SN15]
MGALFTGSGTMSEARASDLASTGNLERASGRGKDGG